MSRSLRRLAQAVLVAAASGALTAGGPGAGVPPAAADPLQRVTGFGSNPGNLAMYSYVPAGMPSGAPLLVLMHGCSQSASDYFSHTGWQKYADMGRFALVLAEQNSGNNSLSCFNWFT